MGAKPDKYRSINQNPYEAKLTALLNSLTPGSVAEHFAFYKLYPGSLQGHMALQKAMTLLQKHEGGPNDEVKVTNSEFRFPNFEIESLISLVNHEPGRPEVKLSDEELSYIEQISSHLHNRKLKGQTVWDIEELKKLPNEEVDLARAICLYHFADQEDGKQLARQYEATLDLMALQILAYLPFAPSDLEKVRAISDFIFHQMRFRFPPHSMWAKDVDHYTFLPSVMDNRHGVCLGVSTLYLCLAQRLDLQLRVFTPPGHIYVAYDNDGELINIETTARGIHIPSSHYLSMHTKEIEERNIKQVIGLNFCNQAANCLHKKEYTTSLELYKKAESYMPEDHFLNMLMGYNYIALNQTEEAEKCLRWLLANPSKQSITQETLAEDYLAKRVDQRGVLAVFEKVDETRESILAKQKELEGILEEFPQFRDGVFQLAVTWLQLGRNKEGLEVLSRYHALDAQNPIVEYYLSILHIQRFNYAKSWQHALEAKQIAEKQGYSPKALKEVLQHLKLQCPSLCHQAR